jgi:UDP-2-acetamido-3-amino-2,3-dideoxy-glucuronate N-acetyltransferase
LLIGNPARQTAWMSEYGHKLKFDETGKATCPESGQIYELKDGIVKRIS